MIIGFVIAILDISIRKIVKDVYLNVKTNMKYKDGNAGFIREGLVDSSSIDKFEEKTKEDSSSKDKKNKSDSENDKEEGENSGCPEDCNAVTTLRKRLTDLIIDATKLKEDVKANNVIIKKQQEIIEELKINVQDLIKASRE